MGNGKVQIIDFDIYSDDELNPSEIKTHSKCELILRLICKESALVSVGFGVVSTDGTYIFGTNFHMMSYPLLPMQPGELSLVKFSWKSHIAGGEYFLNLGCHEPLGESDSFVDVRRSVAHIKFSDTPGSKGFVDLEVIPEVIKVTTSSVMES
jgi:lipopolysaccharide transport system ATP-binding protein